MPKPALKTGDHVTIGESARRYTLTAEPTTTDNWATMTLSLQSGSGDTVIKQDLTVPGDSLETGHIQRFKG